MGNASTRNIIENSIDLSVKAVTDAVQDCATVMTQEQALRIRGDGNVVSNVRFEQMMNVNISCVQDTSVQNDISSKISNEMTQMAESVLGAISLNPGSARADNITRTAIKLGTEILNAFNQKCGSKLDSKQTIKVDGNNNVLEFISFSQSNSLIRDCIQTSSAVNKAKSEIQNTVDQTAKATKKGVDLMLVAAIIAAVALLFAAGGQQVTTVVTSPAFISGVVVLVILFVGTMYVAKRGPFKPDPPVPAPEPDPAEDEDPAVETDPADDEDDAQPAEESYFLAGGRQL